jgi:chromosome segregation ATPase
MKRTILTMAALTFMIGAFLTGCTSSEQKVKDAEEDVAEANEALNEANQEYMDDMANFREETNRKSISNDQMIAELKTRMAKEKASVKADYQTKINDLEARNNELKQRLADYNEEGKDNWDRFKTEFARDMDALGQALHDFGTNSKK